MENLIKIAKVITNTVMKIAEVCKVWFESDEPVSTNNKKLAVKRPIKEYTTSDYKKWSDMDDY